MAQMMLKRKMVLAIIVLLLTTLYSTGSGTVSTSKHSAHEQKNENCTKLNQFLPDHISQS